MENTKIEEPLPPELVANLKDLNLEPSKDIEFQEISIQIQEITKNPIECDQDSQHLNQNLQKWVQFLPKDNSNEAVSSNFTQIINILPLNFVELDILEDIFTVNRGFSYTFEVLVTLTSTKNLTDSSEIARNLLQRVLNTSLVACFLEGSTKNASNGQKFVDYDTFLQVIVSLPNKIANATEGKLDIDVINPFVNHFLKSLEILVENEETYEVNFIAKILSKMLIHYRTYKWTKFMEILGGLCEKDTKSKKTIQEILHKLSQNAVEVAADAILRSEFYIISSLIGTWTENWSYVLGKVPFQVVKCDRVIINLCHYVHEMNQINFMQKILLSWSLKSSILSGDVNHHIYISKYLVLLVGLAKEKLDQQEKNLVKKGILDGTGHHLDSPDPEIRATGMIVSQIIFGFFDANEEEKLNFDFGSFSPNVKKIVKEVRDILSIKLNKMDPISFDEGQLKLKNASKDLKVQKVVPKIVKQVKILPKTEQQEAILSKKELIQAPIDVENDSDDDLITYEQSSDDLPVVGKAKRPKFLMDLHDGLFSDDMDEFEASVISCNDLLKSLLPKSEAAVGINFLKILLHLDAKCLIENFELHIFESCVTIIENHPKEAAPFLCEEFHSGPQNYNVSKRVLMLDILGEASKRLAKLNPILPKEQENPIQMQPKTYRMYKESPEIERKKEIQEIIRARIEQKTRKITSKSQKLPESSNKFAAVAGYFFFPLMQGFGKNQFILESRAFFKNDVDDHLLLAFLQTLSCIMISAVNCPQVIRFAEELFKISQCLRFSRQAKIRLGILHLLATIFMSVSVELLYSHFFNDLMELKEWLDEILSQNVLKRESNKECLAIAESLMKMVIETLTYKNRT